MDNVELHVQKSTQKSQLLRAQKQQCWGHKIILEDLSYQNIQAFKIVIVHRHCRWRIKNSSANRDGVHCIRILSKASDSKQVQQGTPRRSHFQITVENPIRCWIVQRDSSQAQLRHSQQIAFRNCTF